MAAGCGPRAAGGAQRVPPATTVRMRRLVVPILAAACATTPPDSFEHWQERVRQLRGGMTRGEVEELLPEYWGPFGNGTMPPSSGGFGTGSGYVVCYVLSEWVQLTIGPYGHGRPDDGMGPWDPLLPGASVTVVDIEHGRSWDHEVPAK